MSRIGHARVGTSDQNPHSQRDALLTSGCQKIFTNKVTGKLASRTG